MKKALVLVLLFALAAVLGACVGDEETTTTGVTTPTTATTAATTTTTAAPTTTTVAPQEPIALKYATTFRETEAGGKSVQHFCDFIEDATAGVVRFDIYFDGILGTDREELGLVASGSVDMITLERTAYADQVPLLNFPMWATPDAQAAVGHVNGLVFANLETAPLIQAEAEANNIMYLGFISGGGNVFLARTPVTLLSDLAGKTLGVSGSLSAFEALGSTVVETPPRNIYESLATGAIEATWTGLGQTVDLKWYEVAKYYLWDGTYGVGDVFSINLDTWASLTPETQRVFKEAAKDAETFSLELAALDIEANLKVLADAGVTVASLAPDDQKTWYQLLFEADAAGCMARAQNLGIVDDMVTVLRAAAAVTGATWTPPAQ